MRSFNKYRSGFGFSCMLVHGRKLYLMLVLMLWAAKAFLQPCNVYPICGTVSVSLDNMGSVTVPASSLATASTNACGPLSFDVPAWSGDAASCSDAVCLAGGATFPAVQNGGSTNTYQLTSCLGSSPNESWFYFQVTSPGTVIQNISISPSSDVDYAAWGPFTSVADACAALSTANEVSCNYSSVNGGTMSFTASVGFYLVVVTNFGNQAGTVTMTSNTGTATVAPCGGGASAPVEFTYSCDDIGTHVVEVVATDGSGNTSSCNATVIVTDSIPPSITTCPANTTVANCGAAMPDLRTTLVATDNCTASADLVFTQNPVAGVLIGENNGDDVIVTFTVTDEAGSASSCTALITVNDVTPPTAVCQNISVALDNTGSVTVTGAEINGGSTDACGPVSFEVPAWGGDAATCSGAVCLSGGATFPAVQNGGSTNTYQLTSCLGSSPNESWFYFQVTAPGTVVQNISISPSSDVDYAAWGPFPSVADACANLSTANEVSCNYSSVNGGTMSFTASTGYYLVLVANFGNAAGTVTMTSNSGTATVAPCTAAPGAPVEFTYDCTNLGSNVVELVALDAAGNSSTCNATITVVDGIAPTITTCPANSTVSDCGATLADLRTDLVASDNCTAAGDLVVVQSPSAGILFGNENGDQLIVTFTVTDASGNASSCTNIVTVNDATPPLAICEDITVSLDNNGSVTVAGADVDGGSTDACGPVSFDVPAWGGDAATCSDAVCLSGGATFPAVQNGGSTNTYQLTSCLGSSPNESWFYFQVTAPGTVVQNISINPSSDVDYAAWGPFPSVADACSNLSTANEVSCNYSGANGGTMSFTASTGYYLVLVANFGNAAGTVTMTANSGTATVASCTAGPGTPVEFTYDCSDLGVNVVELVVMDATGNTSTCNAAITVVDNIAPVITACPANITVSDCNLAIPNGVSGVTATDNCGVASVSQDPVAGVVFGTADGSQVVVTFTVTDGSGNTSTCSSTITVDDTTNPTYINCPTVMTMIGNDADQCTGKINWAVPAAADDCQLVSNVQISG
ncbi:MAG: hypothetical protein ACK5SQ_10470, partial [Chitinophagales bacterium]